jgi:thiol:disulfide interchange protein DsbD
MILHGNIFDLFIAYGAGVLVSFTPCIYPLLPITVATIAGANTQKTRMAGFLLSLVYALGLAITYSILAILAGLTGRVFGVIQNSPWVAVGIANLFLLFALIMLDVVPFPTFGLGGKKGKDRGVLSVLLMGIASGFIVGPCTAPILGAMLLQIAAKKDLLIGGALILVFAFGMSTLLLLAGTFSGFLASLPKSGPWMDRIKKLIGLAFIIAAEVYLIKAGGLF